MRPSRGCGFVERKFRIRIHRRDGSSASCAGCGCVCDDIELTVRGDRIVEARHACQLGQAWFVQPSLPDAPSCWLNGRPAGLDEGIERAAQLLAAARYPLVYGLEQTSCEAVRLAAGIADWIGAVLDTVGGASGGLAGMSLAAAGEVTCSLGEIANCADLVLVWRANPLVTHPRHFSRYSLAPRGRFVPGGRADRTCVVVNARRTRKRGRSRSVSSVACRPRFRGPVDLACVVRGAELSADDVLAETGVALGAWQDLCDRMKQAKFAVILFDAALGDGRAGHVQVDALWHSFAISTRTRGPPPRRCWPAAMRLEPPASSVLGPARRRPLIWRVAIHGAIQANMAPKKFSRGEVDAALLVGAGPMSNLSPAARRHLSNVGTRDDRVGPTPVDATAAVAFTTAPYGRAAAGTIFRMDGVPLPLRPVLVSPHPGDVEILARLESRAKQLCSGPKRPTAPRRP